MFSSFSRAWQSGSGATDTFPDKGKQRGFELGNRGDGLGRKPSTMSMDRNHSHGPSQISWFPSGQSSPSKSSLGRTISGPAGLSSVKEPPLNNSLFSNDRGELLRRPSVESVHQPVHPEYSETSSISTALPRMLSPIAEQQVEFPPRRRPSMDSTLRTPDSKMSDTFGKFIFMDSVSNPKFLFYLFLNRMNFAATPTHPTFLTRSLKRSVSQTSTSTHRSAASIAAPTTVQTLDQRPIVSVPTLGPAPRKIHRGQPSLPNVSVIYEDAGSTPSFITAPSMHVSISHSESIDIADFADYIEIEILPPRESEDEEREGERERGGVGRESSVYPEEYFPSTASGSIRSSSGYVIRDEGHGEEGEGGKAKGEEEERHEEEEDIGVSDGMYEVELGEPSSEPNTAASSASLLSHPRRFIPSAPPSHDQFSTKSATRSQHTFQTTTSKSSTTVETLIQNRWLKGLSFGGDEYKPFNRPEGSKRDTKVNSACVLFFVGFIAPWCWLIGGWYLSKGGEMESGMSRPQTFELSSWSQKRDSKDNGSRKHSRVPSGFTAKLWNPLVANAESSKDTLPAPATSKHAYHRSQLSWDRGRGKFTSIKVVDNTPIDPWVKRCRLAAYISGCILVLAVIAAFIVWAGLRRT